MCKIRGCFGSITIRTEQLNDLDFADDIFLFSNRHRVMLRSLGWPVDRCEYETTLKLCGYTLVYTSIPLEAGVVEDRIKVENDGIAVNPPTLENVVKAVKELENGKSGLPAELFKHRRTR